MPRIGRAVFFGAVALLPTLPVAAEPLFGLPLACPPGSICPIQQFVDLDPGPGARDPWCGTSTYDGHKGTDFRVLSLRDVARGVEVVAMADGVVRAARDGMEDRLVSTDEDRTSIESRECGNGLILQHGAGLETQYCHMRRGSVRVAPGARVRKGEVLGFVGASGMAAFPHVHVTLRRDGKVIDPFTGLAAGQACAGPGAAAGTGGLMDDAAIAALGDPGLPVLLSAGFADAPVGDKQLVRGLSPKLPDTASAALVGYVWAINLARGDRIRISIDRDGRPFSAQSTDPLDRSKAVYVAYSGKKGHPQPGRYRMRAEILRDGRAIVAGGAGLDVD